MPTRVRRFESQVGDHGKQLLQSLSPLPFNRMKKQQELSKQTEPPQLLDQTPTKMLKGMSGSPTVM